MPSLLAPLLINVAWCHVGDASFTKSLSFDEDQSQFVSLIQINHKKLQRKRSTAIFVAGLEGSGHHLMFDIVHTMYDQYESLPFDVRGSWTKLNSWNCESEWLHSDLEDGVEMFRAMANGTLTDDPRANEDTIWLVPDTCLSYPCGGPEYPHEDKRDRFIPRADWVAEAAAKTDVNLHVMFLFRPLEELLEANCIHRQLEPSCDLYVETMTSNAKALLEQFKTIQAGPRHMTKCLRYGNLESSALALSQLFNSKMSFDGILSEVWKPNSTDTDTDPHYGEDPRILVPNWDELVVEVKNLNDRLESACSNMEFP